MISSLESNPPAENLVVVGGLWMYVMMTETTRPLDQEPVVADVMERTMDGSLKDNGTPLARMAYTCVRPSTHSRRTIVNAK